MITHCAQISTDTNIILFYSMNPLPMIDIGFYFQTTTTVSAPANIYLDFEK